MEGDDTQTGTEVAEEKEKSVGGIGAVEDDLTLRAALYGVMFQSYTDKVNFRLVHPSFTLSGMS